ncbi:hypothetical protein ACFLT8_04110 [Chloroflexota bacterium]
MANSIPGKVLMLVPLHRQRHASPQASTVEKRQSNVANVFTCHDQSLKGRQMLLIDDISASRASLNASTTTLKAVAARISLEASSSQRALKGV